MNKVIQSGFLIVIGLFLLVPVMSFAEGLLNGNKQPRVDVSDVTPNKVVNTQSATINWSMGSVQTLTLGSNPTLVFKNPQTGGDYKLIIRQDITGNRSVVWPASIKWASGIKPTLTVSSKGVDVFNFVYDGEAYLGSAILDYRAVTTTVPTPPILTSNLIGYWKMDGNSNDASGNGHNGTDTGMVFSNPNGVIGGGAGFTAASSSKITIADASSLKPTGNFSVNFWLRTTATNNPAFFSSYYQNANVAGFNIYDNSNKISFVVGNNTGLTANVNYKELIGSSAINDGNYHMWTMVYDGTHMYIYKDGGSSPDASASWSTNPAYASANNVRIGQSSFDGLDTSDYLNGSMDEVGFWGRALTTTEIAQLYNSGAGKQYPF